MLKIARLLMGLAAIAQVGSVRAADDLATLTHRWAELKYLHATDRDRIAQAEALEREAADVAEHQPGAEALLLEANALALTAEFMHASASLIKIRQARDLLLQADRSQPDNPEILVALGSIYYEVPGWPIGFGDKKKAEGYLRQAIAIAPDGRDTNYFLGDFLLETGRAGQAIPVLEKALAAPQQNTVMDRGRRAEIEQSLRQAKHRVRR